MSLVVRFLITALIPTVPSTCSNWSKRRQHCFSTNMKLPDGQSRLDIVKTGALVSTAKRGRMVVSIDRLLEDPKNERKTFRNMDGLVESIKAVGLIEPITVKSE